MGKPLSASVEIHTGLTVHFYCSKLDAGLTNTKIKDGINIFPLNF